ncbi:DinB family protein [Streptomyces sp. JH002]|uniref:DinB family protein n=1 Tax=Streptomyces sp. JH002 TaxID=2763259 RepID=UPI003D805FFC
MSENPTVPSEPGKHIADPRQLLLDYLDYYREVVVSKLAGLSEEELRSSRLPSGWAPVELIWHLAHVERRWLRWGFLGEEVEEPWADWFHGPSGPERWAVPDGVSTAEVLETFQRYVADSRAITADVALETRAKGGGRFDPAGQAPAPALSWILFHLLQEYARHAGHLDVVRELADGVTGE